jgi:hypothetical protein
MMAAIVLNIGEEMHPSSARSHQPAFEMDKNQLGAIVLCVIAAGYFLNNGAPNQPQPSNIPNEPRQERDGEAANENEAQG